MITQFEPEEDAEPASSRPSGGIAAQEPIPAADAPVSRCDKAYYLDLIKRQSQQMRELGFLAPLAAEEIARIEASLEKLNLDLLQAIARGAGNLLRGN